MPHGFSTMFSGEMIAKRAEPFTPSPVLIPEQTLRTRRRSGVRYAVLRNGVWVHEDQVIMETILGQSIPPGMKVTHCNLVHNDNRVENLFLQLPTEPLMYSRINHEKRRCVRCDNEYFVSADHIARLKRRNDFCTRHCHMATVPRRRWCTYRDWPPHPDPDRWRAWMPALAWATRMALDPDPGPGHPQRYPDIAITPPPDDLPYFGRYGEGGSGDD